MPRFVKLEISIELMVSFGKRHGVKCSKGQVRRKTTPHFHGHIHCSSYCWLILDLFRVPASNSVLWGCWWFVLHWNGETDGTQVPFTFYAKYMLSEVSCVFKRPVFIQSADRQYVGCCNRPYHTASHVFVLKADKQQIYCGLQWNKRWRMKLEELVR